jgi:hypothetical protein
MESHILAKEDLPFRVVYLIHHIVSNTIIEEIDGSPKESLEWLNHWLKGVFWIPLSVGPPKMGEEDDRLGIMAGQMLESRYCA